MSTIKVVCIDQTLAFNNTPVITSGGLKEDFISFTFCALWSGFTRTAVFWRNEKEVYHQTLDAEDRCQIPPEVTGEDGVIYFGVFGVNAKGVQRTSEVLNYRIHKGAITTGTKPSDPTPDIYTQILARCQDVKDEVAVERSRIDNLIKLEPGSTTGDAELADIRVGYEGTVHTTAGHAVRNQVTSIERRLSSVVKYVSGTETVELICHNDGYYGTTGQFTKADGAAKYAVVKNVLSGDKYVFDTYLNDPAIPALVYFDANGECVGYEKTGTGEVAMVHQTVVIPDGVTRIVLQSVNMSDNFPRLSIVDRVLELSSYTKAESDAKYGSEIQNIRADTDEKIAMIATVEKDTDSWKPVNVISGIAWGESGTYWNNVGGLVSSDATANYTALSELVPAVPGASYYTEGFRGEFKFLTSDKTKIESHNVSVVTNQLSLTAPTNAAYIAISFTHNNASVPIENVKVYRSTMTEEERESLPWKVTMPEVEEIRTDVNAATKAAEQANKTAEAVEKHVLVTDEKIDMIATIEKDTGDWEPINIIEGIAWGEQGSFWGVGGTIVSNTATANYMPLSELVPVIPGASYYTERFKGQIRYFETDKTHIEAYVVDSVIDGAQYSGIAPTNAAYMSISAIYGSVDFAKVKVCRSSMTEEEREALPWKVTYGFSDHSISLEKMDNDALSIINPMRGKVIVNFGDSIFGNARPPHDVSTMLGAFTGATVKNCSFGGCRMAVHEGHWDAFSMYRLSYAIANNDFSVQDEALNYDDRTSYAEEPLQLIKETDFAAVDIVTIAYGTNDWFGNNVLDNAENTHDTTTVCGALRYSIETLLSAFPKLRIFILLPTYRFWMDDSGAFTEDSETRTNKHGKTLVEYGQAITDVAAAYNLPVIDNYKQLGVNKFNRAHYFPANDGTHHNQNGRDLIAAHIAKKLF